MLFPTAGFSPTPKGATGVKSDFAARSFLKEPWHIIDEFDSTYWSGLDVSIYAGPYLLDEVVNLSFQVAEQVIPYYGYAHYTAQRMHRGQRLITGTFTINFKQSHYLLKVLDKLSESGQDIAPNSELFGETRTRQGINVGPVEGTPLHQLTAAMAANGATLSDVINLIAAPWIDNQSAQGIPSAGTSKERVSTISQEFSRALWGEDYIAQNNPPPVRTGKSTRPLLKGPENGFSLRISYGQYDEDSIALRSDAFGSLEHFKPHIEKSPGVLFRSVYTIERLTGVEITGVAKALDDSGRPVMEQYAFLARDYEDVTEEPHD